MSQKEKLPYLPKEYPPKQNPLEKELYFEKRISKLLAEGRSFHRILDIFHGEGVEKNSELRYFDYYEDGATILKIAKEKGIISKEISGQMVDLLRKNYSEISPSHKSPDYKASKKGFIAELRKSAENDGGKTEKTMQNFSKIVSSEIKTMNRQKVRGETIPQDKEVLVKEYQNLNNEIFNLSSDYPVRMFLHFYDNGDLKWLWGINDNDSFNDISTKSHGFRIADSQNIDW